jgi:hypothetical protein
VAGTQAAGLVSALAARGSAAVLPLGRLDPAAMAAMTRACLNAADLPDAVHAFVAERAEGIPFLVEEILAGLVGEGALTEQDGRWRAADLLAPAVPATFADAVRRRLNAVDAASRHVIGAAAVLGRRFDWALLGPVTGRGPVGRGRREHRGRPRVPGRRRRPGRRLRGAGRGGPGPPGRGGPAGPRRAAGGGSRRPARGGVRGPRGDRPGRAAA